MTTTTTTAETTQCPYKTAGLREECDVTEDCIVENSVCKEEGNATWICRCLTGYLENPENTTCLVVPNKIYDRAHTNLLAKFNTTGWSWILSYHTPAFYKLCINGIDTTINFISTVSFGFSGNLEFFCNLIRLTLLNTLDDVTSTYTLTLNVTYTFGNHQVQDSLSATFHVLLPIPTLSVCPIRNVTSTTITTEITTSIGTTTTSTTTKITSNPVETTSTTTKLVETTTKPIETTRPVETTSTTPTYSTSTTKPNECTTIQTRSIVSLGHNCGNHSNTGYCTVEHSACILNNSDEWICECSSGYTRDKTSQYCVKVPSTLFPVQKVVFNVLEKPEVDFKVGVHMMSNESRAICTLPSQVHVFNTDLFYAESSCENVTVILRSGVSITNTVYEFIIKVVMSVNNNQLFITDVIEVVVNVTTTDIETTILTATETTTAETTTTTAEMTTTTTAEMTTTTTAKTTTTPEETTATETTRATAVPCPKVRPLVGLHENCGKNSDEAICSLDNSVCMFDTQNMTWMCMCSLGYVPDTTLTECFAVPNQLFAISVLNVSMDSVAIAGSTVLEVPLIEDARRLCQVSPLLSLWDPSGVFLISGNCSKIEIETAKQFDLYIKTYNFAIKVTLNLYKSRVLLNDFLFVHVNMLDTAYPTQTTAECVGSYGNRTAMGLTMPCGNHSSIGYCALPHSSCSEDGGGDWKCQCSSGYVAHRDGDQCKKVPEYLLSSKSQVTIIPENTPTNYKVVEFNFTKDVQEICLKYPTATLRESFGVFNTLATCNSVKVTTNSEIPSSVTGFSLMIDIRLFLEDNKVIVNDFASLEIKIHKNDTKFNDICVVLPDGIIPGTFIATLSPDLLVSNDELSMHLTEVFQISNRGVITTTKELELLGTAGARVYKHDIMRKQADQVSPSKISTIRVVVVRKTLNVEIEEGKEEGFLLTSFNLPDTNITVSSSGMPSDKFSLTENELKIGANKLDFETTKTESFTLYSVVACEGMPSLTSSTSVTVTVQNMNDNAPEFISVEDYVFDKVKGYQASIFPSSLSNLFVQVIHAIDKDYNSVQYSIEDHKSYFSVDNNGIVRTRTSTGSIPFSNNTQNAKFSGVISVRIRASDGVQNTFSILTVFLGIQPVTNYGMIFRATVMENKPAGEFVTYTNISGYKDYSFASVSASAFLKVDAVTGKVSTNGVFDREVKSEFHFSLTASKDDTSICSVVVLGDVNVIVGDANDNAPIFSSEQKYVGTMEEEASPGTRIKMVNEIFASDADIGINAEYNFSIAAGDDTGLLTIDSKLGIIRTAAVIDREDTPGFNLQVVVDDGVNQNTASVTIQVLDINDNEPKFTNGSQRIEIREDGSTGTFVITVKATDDDDANNGKVIHSLSGDEGFFKIDQGSGTISVAHMLDRESKESYKVIVSARDSGSPPKTSSASVDIVITDVNDNLPVIEPSTLSSTVNENLICPAKVLKISASDPDYGQNGDVFFEPISDGSWSKFTISTEGDIYCNETLDFETSKRHLLTIKASDKGVPTRSVTATVTISITDINDNAPVFQGDFSDGEHFMEVNKNDFSKATPLMVVSAVDADSGALGQVFYSLVSGDDKAEIDSDGIIKTKPSAPSTGNYSLILQARDGGKPPLYSQNATLIIKVLEDKITNKIVFKTQEFLMNVSEAESKQSPIGKIKESENINNPESKVLKFELITITTLFVINEDTGEVSSNAVLDREEKDRHQIVVRTYDADNKPNSDLALIKVAVNDVNDNTPLFEKSLYAEILAEDKPIGHTITSVIATDADTGANADLRYYALQIPGHEDCLEAYNVDDVTGKVVLSKKVDFETTTKCNFRIQAFDGGSPPKNSTTSVEINILDVNDNDPEFLNTDTDGRYKIHMSESLRINDKTSAFGRAVDRDSRANGDVTFTITNNYACPFTVERVIDESGYKIVLRVDTHLDYENKTSYSCIIKATDKGSVPRSTSVTVGVTIDDINDNAPVFPVKAFNVKMKRQVSIGYEVLGPQNATDSDSGINAQIQYSIDEEYNRYFAVDSNTGILTVKDNLLDLQKDEVRLHIIAIDRGTPSLTGSTMVNITIEDENARPEFQNRLVERTVKENTVFLTPIYTATATDRNGSYIITCDCTYRLEREHAKFSIDDKTGAVSLKAVLDRETEPVIKLSIVARDKGSPAKDSLPLELTIQVEDENDNYPVFRTQGDYVFITHQHTPVGTLLGQVTAVDIDEGENAVPAYDLTEFLHSGTPLREDVIGGQFTHVPVVVDANNGSIYTNGSLHVNATRNFYLLIYVNAKDSKSTSLPNDRTKVTVQVNFDDSNKHTPVFTKDIYQIERRIESYSSKNSVIVTVTATDKDSGEEGRIRYYISSGNVRDVYAVNRNSGAVYLQYSIDANFEADTSLIIVAQDNGLIPRHSNCTVEIRFIGTLEACIPAKDHRKGIEEAEDIGENYLAAMATLAALFTVSFIISLVLIYKNRALLNAQLAPGTMSDIFPVDSGKFDVSPVYTGLQSSTDDGRYNRSFFSTCTMYLPDDDSINPAYHLSQNSNQQQEDDKNYEEPVPDY